MLEKLPNEEHIVSDGACPRCGDLGQVFECPNWPECGCPDGTISPVCPGETVPCPDCLKRS